MNKTYSVGIAALVVGLIIGYLFAANTVGGCMHKMPDGTMMMNSGNMSDMMADMNSALAGKTGDSFDRAFLTEMIVHHEGAVDMAQSALKAAGHDEIKAMANDIISAQTREISQMKAWMKAWFGN